jgi:hypothetical protein
VTNVVERRPGTETGAPAQRDGRAAKVTRPLATPWGAQGHRKTLGSLYRSIQTARAEKGGPICVGSCAIYRRAALVLFVLGASELMIAARVLVQPMAARKA